MATINNCYALRHHTTGLCTPLLLLLFLLLQLLFTIAMTTAITTTTQLLPRILHVSVAHLMDVRPCPSVALFLRRKEPT
jgi:hypothetical protein